MVHIAPYFTRHYLTFPLIWQKKDEYSVRRAPDVLTNPRILPMLYPDFT